MHNTKMKGSLKENKKTKKKLKIKYKPQKKQKETKTIHNHKKTETLGKKHTMATKQTRDRHRFRPSVSVNPCPTQHPPSPTNPNYGGLPDQRIHVRLQPEPDLLLQDRQRRASCLLHLLPMPQRCQPGYRRAHPTLLSLPRL